MKKYSNNQSIISALSSTLKSITMVLEFAGRFIFIYCLFYLVLMQSKKIMMDLGIFNQVTSTIVYMCLTSFAIVYNPYKK